MFDLNTKEAIDLPKDAHIEHNTDALTACPVVFHNRVILFGSITNGFEDQIVAFENNKLVRKSDLEGIWGNKMGGCASMNDLFVLVCFFEANYKRCLKVSLFTRI